ncbi:MAG TPA: hypothetical protein VNE62_01035, partial [Actinomycetota bacterium]|nr:hypothetical protein [Actinomycetota bacterium]
MSLEDSTRFAGLARVLAPGDLTNVVSRGTSRMMDGQSVVLLDEQAFALFRDVGGDGVADGDSVRPTPTLSPTATPGPTPAPAPTPSAPTPSSPSPSPTSTFPV